MKITPIIGLEVHVELKTLSKMFCGCDANHFHTEPNTHTCPVCLGLPGALPVPNKKACEWCIKLGLALGCTINEETFFERKNYFYPDLAKSYQISQLQKPFCINGKLGDVRINRVHMEEDTGKSVHVNGETLLDFNRSGVPLVEIVSEPDIKSPEDAKSYLLKIQQIVRYLGISDADIEKGSMRCEPTVNLCIDLPAGRQAIYTPLVEIKNVASLTGVMTAIQYEIDRQAKQYSEDQVTKNSTNKTTRGWDADKQQTFLQREKEGSADYRYFPEPDIPPVIFTAEQIEAIRATLPEMPEAKIAKYKSLGLSDYDANLLSDDVLFSNCYEKALGTDPTPELAKFIANMFNGPIRTYLNDKQEEIDDKKISAENFKKLFEEVVLSKSISSSVARQVITKSYLTGDNPIKIASLDGLMQISDSSQIEEIAKQVIADNPKAVADYQKNPMSIGFLVGQVMKTSGGSANPQVAKEILEKLLVLN